MTFHRNKWGPRRDRQILVLEEKENPRYTQYIHYCYDTASSFLSSTDNQNLTNHALSNTLR